MPADSFLSLTHRHHVDLIGAVSQRSFSLSIRLGSVAIISARLYIHFLLLRKMQIA